MKIQCFLSDPEMQTAHIYDVFWMSGSVLGKGPNMVTYQQAIFGYVVDISYTSRDGKDSNFIFKEGCFLHFYQLSKIL